MRNVTILSILVLPAVAAVLSGCAGSNTKAIDLRGGGNLVMRIPYGTIESATFLVTETKDGYYRLEKKSYTGDLLIGALEKKPFIVRKGVCLKLERPSGEQKHFVNALAAMCIERNLNLFIDEPGGDYVTQDTGYVDWVIRREHSR